VRSADGAVVVEVETGRNAAVRGGDVEVGVVDRLGPVVPHREVVGADRFDSRPACDVVELVEQHNVGAGALDDLGNVGGLRIIRCRQILEQLALGRATQRSVERGDAETSGR
jgi:hypothetical protein